MRMVLGLVSLLVALAIVAVLAKKQLGATRVAVPPVVGAPATDSSPQTVRDQSRQIQEQYKQQLDTALQQGRDRLDKEEQ